MELIYTDHNRYALGQLSSFDIDFDATGTKDFELTIDEFLLKKDYWFYIDGTEIGGIVDSVTVNTEDNSVKYNGRNFRGILSGKVIDVPRGQTFVSVQGEIDDVLNELFAEAEIDDIFECLEPETEDVDYYVDYSFEPFCTLYDGIIGIANSINFKLTFAYNVQTNKVEITPMLIENFTDFLTYTKNSSVSLEMQDNAMSVNHFVLVGYDENTRYQIDLFINENSQVMDFATVLEPIKDSQYILDNRNQQFFGIDEKVQVTINDSISPIENYELLTEKPKDWSKNYASYFYQKTEDVEGDEANVTYANIEPRTAYRKLSTEPSDWEQNYASYYYKEDGEYKGVDADSSTVADYYKLKKKPKGWKNNYKDYFYHTTDGVSWFWTSVSGKTKEYYKKQKYRPSDWDKNWKNYYQVTKMNGKTSYDQAGTYYRKSKSKSKKDQGKLVKETSKKAPKWVKYKFYTKYSKTYAPRFTRDPIVYVKVETTTEETPTFVADHFYQQYETAPKFTSAFRKVLDHYGGMISALFDDMEIYPVNEQKVSLADFDADIGDVVGGYDEKTGITMSAPILNIIYRIERGIQRSIEYVLGG